MEANPLPKNETDRLKALNGYYILDTLREDEFDRFTQLIAIICETPISLISLLDKKRQWFKSRVGLNMPETDRSLAFCQYTIMDKVVMQVPDATIDTRFKDNILVTGYPYIKFYAGFPLIDPNGFALGSLCVIDHKRKVLTEVQKKVLQLIAEEVTALIVQRKEREHILNFQKLFNLCDDLVCIAGFDGYFKSVNPAFSKTLGYDEKLLLKTPFLDLVHPDDRNKTNSQKVILKAGESSINFINRYKTKNGAYRVIEWTTSPEKDQPFLYAIGRDITRQEEQEKELRRTKEMLEETNNVARVGGWEYDIILEKIYWSSVTKEILEVAPDFVPDLSGAIHFYKEGEDRKRIGEAINNAVTMGQAWDLELKVLTAKGKELWVKSLGHAEIRDGKSVRLFGTFQDINDKKMEALNLAKSSFTIMQQNNRLLNFAHIVSHNLRSHTGNLKMVLSLINAETDTQGKIKLMKHLGPITTSLNETIENLTEIVSVETDVVVAKVPLKFEKYFNAALSTLSATISNENAVIAGDFTGATEVEYIPAYMDSIMLNFISNALKYKHPDRAPLVTVTSFIEDGHTCLMFSDNGIGIDLVKNGKDIFGMYKTFHNHPDARGVGLFITKNQIESAGGSIEVASTVDVGSTFKIIF